MKYLINSAIFNGSFNLLGLYVANGYFWSVKSFEFFVLSGMCVDDGAVVSKSLGVRVCVVPVVSGLFCRQWCGRFGGVGICLSILHVSPMGERG